MKTFKKFLSEQNMPKNKNAVKKILLDLAGDQYEETFIKLSECSVNDDLTVDVEGKVILTNDNLIGNQIPVKFGKVDGYFIVNGKKHISTFENFPSECGSLQLIHSGFTNLIGSPKILKNELYISNCNNFTSFEGANYTDKITVYVNGKIKDLNGLMPCRKLLLYSTSLEFKHVLEKIDFPLETFVYESENNSEKISLRGIHKYFSKGCEEIQIENTISDGGIGLLKIKNLQDVWAGDKKFDIGPLEIIKKYLYSSRDILACQQDLIDAGYEEFAQL